jgi:hypothetical protein
MKKILLSLCAIVITIVTSLSAQNQNKCGTMEHLAALKAADPTLEARMADLERQTQQWVADHPDQRTAAVITVPVVFHVVYNTSAQNISDAQCQYQLAQLNADYARTNSDAGNTPAAFQSVAANTQVQFCLAVRDPNGNATSGIIHKQTSSSSFSSNDNVKHNSTGGDDAWAAGSYLNIWTCNFSGGLLGYAQFPGGPASTDGVAILYSSVGSIAHPGTEPSYNLGRTATHEIGHWLDLHHIWGDSNCGNDLVSDTPTQQTSNFGCPNFPHKTCGNTTNGDMFMNYMDYTDDNCMNIFTAGQTTRITAALNGARSTIQSSMGCTPVGGGCNVPSGLNASSVTSSSATLNWGSVSGANSYNVQYRKTGTTTWTSTTSTTTSKAISGLTASTQYEFQVQSVCTGSLSAFSGSANFTTSGGACSDNFEPNETRAQAPTVNTNVDIVGLITPSGDKDLFKFTTVSPNTNIMITLSNLPADYDLKLLNSGGGLITSSSNGGTTNESIIRNVSTAATYYAKVVGFSGANNATQCYTLHISTGSSPFRTAEDVESEIIPGETLSVYPNPAKDLLNVQFNSSTDGNVDINIIDMVGRSVLKVQQIAAKGMNKFELNLSELNKGIYFVDVNNGVSREIRKIILDK